MKELKLTIALWLLSVALGFGQNLTQTVRGTLVDYDNNAPLIGATVIVLGSEPIMGAMVDVDGKFRLENIPTGRVTLQISYIGYVSKTIPNIVVNSGKEVFLDLSMEESVIKMDEIVISATENNSKALNDLAIVSARSVSAEETTRYAGGFDDPSRIMSNFAGVTATQDGSNDIIVRGNSPKYIQWRLEGIQITNPNHFADQSSVGGSVSTLNNKMLATSDFYTGAFSPEYGDVLSGVYDVRLRTGNNEKMEGVFGFGILGTDLTLEGPLKKGYGGSYLVNYRYSTASLISEMGLVDIDGVPKFQDASFKLMLPTKKLGSFSLFGLAGSSTLAFKDVSPDVWQTPGDRFMNTNIQEDLNKDAQLLNVGINHLFTINKNSYINTTVAFSGDRIEDDINESTIVKQYDSSGELVGDSVVSSMTTYKSQLKNSTYRMAISYHLKFNAKSKIQIGTKYSAFNYDFYQSRFEGNPASEIPLSDFNERIQTCANFITWKYKPYEDLTIVTGIHNMVVLFNEKYTIEPRLAVNWRLNNTNTLSAGYGKHSTMESIHHYFAKVEQPEGSYIEPNNDLGLLKAHHFVLGYEKYLGKNIRAKTEVYYQQLYDLPVENDKTSYYATINEDRNFQYVDLVNEGTGKNYGVELTVERHFSNNYYFLVNGSLYNSTYQSLEGVERNTRFNNNYLVNILAGKEFVGLGKKQNQTLGLNAKIFFGGGQKYIPLLRDEQGNLDVDPANNEYWDYDKAYDDKIEDIYQITVSASYKWNKPKTTHELFLSIDNVTNNKGKLTEYYDESEPGSIGYVTQFGVFPNLMYRMYF